MFSTDEWLRLLYVSCVFIYSYDMTVSRYWLLGVMPVGLPTMDFKPSVSVLFGHYSLPW